MLSSLWKNETKAVGSGALVRECSLRDVTARLGRGGRTLASLRNDRSSSGWEWRLAHIVVGGGV